jgi:transposase
MASSLALARQIGLLPGASKQAAIDSTGYEAGHTSQYYGRLAGIRKSRFPKLTTVADTRTHLYLWSVANQGPYPDNREFRPAVTQAHVLQPFRQLLADAGYESEAAHQFCREQLGVISIIPTTRRGRPRHDGRKSPMTGRYRKRLYTRFPKKTFGQRWQVESAFSQDKRRFGSAVRGRSYHSRCRNLRLRVLVHNAAIIRRLINSDVFNRARLTWKSPTAITAVSCRRRFAGRSTARPSGRCSATYQIRITGPSARADRRRRERNMLHIKELKSGP